ncbi:alpha/beta fold hydrolase [Jiangella alkaliphila]|uniref:Pimeloyl-ACP methyl ester carboxylesterase n=1 Tax=Jiangella alkaliphila TaxID=419479 RepID=A0A1H2I6R6_9ACTN|nr:alpha/beta hydrolase [Jiangella alkaliphila]SDU39791.1 Pimeloyl-ACP methyl ester carboxylesterase [Jiangella alkaliphila]
MTGRVRPTEHLVDDADPALAYGRLPGAGPTVVYLHGLGARWQVFAPLMLRLRDDVDQLAPDFRGHGGSGRAPEHYGAGDFAADTARFVRATASGQVVVYGHSLGGWVGLVLAASYPSLVHSLVVADSAIFPERLDPSLVVGYLADLPIALRSMAKSLDQLDPEVMASFRDGRMLAGFDPHELLARVRCPTLLLQGDPERGALMGDDDVSDALKLLRGAGHVRLDGLGHGLHVEDAERVAAQVRTFVCGAPGRREG